VLMGAELDRGRRAGLGAGGRLVVREPVVAEGALLRDADARHVVVRPDADAVLGATLDDPEGAGADAIPAAVADVVLDDDRAVLAAEERARGADVEAAGVGAVLAHVGGHQPAELRQGPDDRVPGHGGAAVTPLSRLLLRQQVTERRPVPLPRGTWGRGGQGAVPGRCGSGGLGGRRADRRHPEVDELTPGLTGGGDPVLCLLDEGDVSPRARAEVA